MRSITIITKLNSHYQLFQKHPFGISSRDLILASNLPVIERYWPILQFLKLTMHLMFSLN